MSTGSIRALTAVLCMAALSIGWHPGGAAAHPEVHSAGHAGALTNAADSAASSPTETAEELCAVTNRPASEALAAENDLVGASDTLPGWDDDGRVVDVLVVYTALAASDFRKRGLDINASIARAAAQTDSAFRNSGIDLRLNVVHHQQIGYVEDTVSKGSDLARIAGAAGTEMRDLRRAHRADVVALIRYHKGGQNVAQPLRSISTTPSNLRLRYSRAYAVVRSRCVDESFRCFAHEIGHLFGANHNQSDQNAPGLYSYSDGYHFYAVQQGKRRCFGTMMDYPCAGRRILHFSNPDIRFLGVRTGVRGSANNARTINTSKLFVANYHQSRERP